MDKKNKKNHPHKQITSRNRKKKLVPREHKEISIISGRNIK